MAVKVDEAAKRRVRAGRLLLEDKAPAEVARTVGAPRRTVYRWLGVLQEQGIERNDEAIVRSFISPRSLSMSTHQSLVDCQSAAPPIIPAIQSIADTPPAVTCRAFSIPMPSSRKVCAAPLARKLCIRPG